MAYPFDAISAIDPDDPSRVAADSIVTIFAPGDTLMTPIAITDTAGAPLENPISVNSLGFGPAFQADIPTVAWLGGELTGFFHSVKGLEEAAAASATSSEASRVAAEAAAAAAAAAGVGVPAGGAAGEVLTKSSSTDFDVAWGAGGGGASYGAGVMVVVNQVGSGYTRPTSDPTIRYVFTGTADPGAVALEDDRWERLD